MWTFSGMLIQIPCPLYTVKPVFKGHLNIQEKVSLHHRFLNMGQIGHCFKKVSPDHSVPEDRFYYATTYCVAMTDDILEQDISLELPSGCLLGRILVCDLYDFILYSSCLWERWVPLVVDVMTSAAASQDMYKSCL